MICSKWIEDEDIIKFGARFKEKFPDGYPESQINVDRKDDRVEWIAENRWGNKAVLATLIKNEQGELVFTTI